MSSADKHKLFEILCLEIESLVKAHFNRYGHIVPLTEYSVYIPTLIKLYREITGTRVSKDALESILVELKDEGLVYSQKGPYEINLTKQGSAHWIRLNLNKEDRN